MLPKKSRFIHYYAYSDARITCFVLIITVMVKTSYCGLNRNTERLDCVHWFHFNARSVTHNKIQDLGLVIVNVYDRGESNEAIYFILANDRVNSSAIRLISTVCYHSVVTLGKANKAVYLVSRAVSIIEDYYQTTKVVKRSVCVGVCMVDSFFVTRFHEENLIENNFVSPKNVVDCSFNLADHFVICCDHIDFLMNFLSDDVLIIPKGFFILCRRIEIHDFDRKLSVNVA